MPEVRVALLGPLGVRGAGGWTAPRPPLLRAVLAALALADGAELTRDALYAAAWPAGQAGPARSKVHLAVHRLRRWLQDARTEVTVDTEGSGYRLDLAGGRTDVAQFRDLVARARRADPAEATRLLTAALAVWRGSPLADVAAADELAVARLRREWRAASLAGAEAALAAGDVAAASGFACPPAAEDPLDEAAQALVVRALAAAGRRTDALEAYERTRAHLADELGVDPGPELHAAHVAVLRQPTPVATRPAPRAPCTLPGDVPDFTGRAAAVTDLVTACQENGDQGARTLVVLSGAAGAGKSTLAVHIAHRLRAAYPDGQLYLNLHGFGVAPLPAAEATGQLLRALGVPHTAVPLAADERSALLRALTVDRRYLFVLDDAVEEAQVRPVLPGAGSAVLITSRRPLSGLEGAYRYELPAFRDDEALALLTKVVGAHRVGREPRAAAEIVRRAAGLPLAVRIIAGRLAARTDRRLGEVAAELADESRRLDLLATGDLDVRASIGLSYRVLPPAHRRALRRVALLAAPEVPAWVFGADTPTIVDELVALHLVESIGQDEVGQVRYRLHDLVRAYARERASEEDSEAARRAALTELCAGWLGLAEAADVRLRELPRSYARPGGAPRRLPVDPAVALADPLAWFEAERGALLAVARQAAELRLGPLAWELPTAMTYYLELTVRLGERGEAFRHALTAARADDDPVGVAYARLGLAAAQHDAGAFRPALAGAEEAAQAFARLADPWGAAEAAVLRALLHEQLGDVRAAYPRLREALRLRRQAGDRVGLGYTLTWLGRFRYDYHNSPAAARHYRNGLALLRASGARRPLALGLRRVAMWHEQEGRIDEALAGYRECLDLVREIRDPEGEAYLLLNLGALFVEWPQLGDPRAHLTAALRWFERFDDGRGLGRTRHALGRLALREGDPATAAAHLTEAVRRLTAVPRLCAAALADLGDAQARLDEHERAVARLREAEQTFVRIGALAGARRVRDRLREVGQGRDGVEAAGPPDQGHDRAAVLPGGPPRLAR